MKFELTEKEAKELLSVAGNGYGSGDFYGVSEKTSKGNGYGGRREEQAFLRAFKKIAIKLKLTHTEP